MPRRDDDEEPTLFDETMPIYYKWLEEHYHKVHPKQKICTKLFLHRQTNGKYYDLTESWPSYAYDPPRKWGDTLPAGILEITSTPKALIVGPGTVNYKQCTHRHYYDDVDINNDADDSNGLIALAKHAQDCLDFVRKHNIDDAQTCCHDSLEYSPSLISTPKELEGPEGSRGSRTQIVLAFSDRLQLQRDEYYFSYDLMMPKYDVLLKDYQDHQAAIDARIAKKRAEPDAAKYDVDEQHDTGYPNCPEYNNPTAEDQEAFVISLEKHFHPAQTFTAECPMTLPANGLFGVLLENNHIVGFIPIWQLLPRYNPPATDFSSQRDGLEALFAYRSSDGELSKLQYYRPEVTKGLFELFQAHHAATAAYKDAKQSWDPEVHIGPMKYRKMMYPYQPKNRIFFENLPPSDPEGREAKFKADFAALPPEKKRAIIKNRLTLSRQAITMLYNQPQLWAFKKRMMAVMNKVNLDDPNFDIALAEKEEKDIDAENNKVQDMMAMTHGVRGGNGACSCGEHHEGKKHQHGPPGSDDDEDDDEDMGMGMGGDAQQQQMMAMMMMMMGQGGGFGGRGGDDDDDDGPGFGGPPGCPQM